MRSGRVMALAVMASVALAVPAVPQASEAETVGAPFEYGWECGWTYASAPAAHHTGISGIGSRGVTCAGSDNAKNGDLATWNLRLWTQMYIVPLDYSPLGEAHRSAYTGIARSTPGPGVISISTTFAEESFGRNAQLCLYLRDDSTNKALGNSVCRSTDFSSPLNLTQTVAGATRFSILVGLTNRYTLSWTGLCYDGYKPRPCLGDPTVGRVELESIVWSFSSE